MLTDVPLSRFVGHLQTIKYSRMKNSFRPTQSRQPRNILLVISILFLIFSATQLGLFSAASIQISSLACYPAYLIFTVITGSYGLTFLFSILLILTTLMSRLYVSCYMLTVVCFAYKVGLIVMLAMTSRNRLGYCYINDSLTDWMYGAFAAEAVLMPLLAVMVWRYQKLMVSNNVG